MLIRRCGVVRRAVSCLPLHTELRYHLHAQGLARLHNPSGGYFVGQHNWVVKPLKGHRMDIPTRSTPQLK